MTCGGAQTITVLTCASTLSQFWKEAEANWDWLNFLIHAIHSFTTHPSPLLPISPPTPTLHLPLARKSGLCEPVAWQSVHVFAYFKRGFLQVHVCAVSQSLAFVILSAVTLSFIRGRPAAHRLSGYSFTVLAPCLLQHVGGWFLTHGNLGPTLCWNNRGPVSIRAL